MLACANMIGWPEAVGFYLMVLAALVGVAAILYAVTVWD